MKFSALAFSAVVGLAAAQMEMLSEIPQCALDCFTTSISSSSCGLTDFYCQCSTDYEKIQKTSLECLCNSECTTSDLAKVYKVSTKLCTDTLKEHGEEFSAEAPMESGICNTGNGGASSASSSNSSGTAQPTGSNSTSSASPSGTSGADFEGAASSNFGKSIAAIAVGGLAFLAI